ncbi:hypothetical protein PU629_15020 [Pullulanibacillus sp. KACC 23026]|uniref:PilN domain-containing protein n=1 Tax=Pullulanibacillus sp. KACC 23026 TaxID=3028315 RepID=UPI0023AFBC32|nr:hypothetical protein [Pullulanibacillus sp. KACC 23026]WEG11464.1 hypothetical protein PU629_15020 [Pullulanibacillus sp. KACC 23026]
MTIEINLIPLKTRKQKWGKPVSILSIIIFVLLVAGLTGLYFQKIHERNQAHARLQTIQKIIQKHTNDQANVTQLLALQSEATMVTNGAPQSEALLMTFVGLLPKNGTFLTFDYQNGVITLTGQFKGLDEVAAFYHAVQTNSLVSQATINNVNATSATSCTANMTIQIDATAYQALGGKK